MTAVSACWPVPIRVQIDTRVVESATRSTAVGAYVVVLTTALVDPRVPVSVTSTYVAHQLSATHATHLTLRPGRDPELHTRMHPIGELSLEDDERPGCLYEHLQHVLAALQSLSCDARIDVLDGAAELLDN